MAARRQVLMTTFFVLASLLFISSRVECDIVYPPPPVAFYPFQYKPQTNFTSNGTYYADPKYFFAPYNYSYNHSVQYGGSLFLGYIWPIDRLLYNQSFVKTPRWWSSREKIIEYPGYLPPGHTRNETITAIRIYDRTIDGSRGYANILSGGVGYTFVKIRLYSGGKRRGFNFLVQIFGH